MSNSEDLSMEDITKRVAALSDKELSNLGKAISNELRKERRQAPQKRLNSMRIMLESAIKKEIMTNLNILKFSTQNL